jgi:hypothetical protein
MAILAAAQLQPRALAVEIGRSAARFGLIDRSHSPRLPLVTFCSLDDDPHPSYFLDTSMRWTSL